MLEELKLTDHLEELRKKLIIAGLSIGVLAIVSFFFSDFLIEVISSPIKQSVYSLYFLSPYEAFMTKMKISVVSGIILSLPVLFFQLWQFVSPGLYLREKRVVFPLVVGSTFLFVLGALFAYFIVIPMALDFFLNFQTTTLVPLISIGSYISFFLSFIFIFGIMFDLPVVLISLIWFRVMGTPFLSCQRKLVVVLIFVLSALLTPTADVFTQCLLAIPLWLLFEVSILIGKQIERRRSSERISNPNP